MARKKEEVTLDNIGLNSHDFKHLETTKDIEIELKNDRGYPLRPNAAHKWTAKVATRGTGKDSYVGDYNVTVAGGKLIVDSAEFTKLAPGEYELELWEQWDGETSIYPSPSQRVPFTINRNITDMSGEVVKQTTIQDIVNSAVEHVGLNLEVENTGSGTVSSRYEDGKIKLTFALPQGPQGDPGKQGLPGITPHIDPETGNWFTDHNTGVHAQGIKGEPGHDGVSPQIQIGEVNTLPAGQNATATVTEGENGLFTINVGIPAGPKGETGGINRVVEPELSIGTITTLTTGAQATASLSKSSDTAYVINLGIPTGPQGQQGNPGSDGQKGDPGSDGKPGSAGVDGVTPHIDPATGNWVTTQDTGVKAQGPQGKPGVSPSINPDNGHWMVGATDTGVAAGFGINLLRGTLGKTVHQSGTNFAISSLGAIDIAEPGQTYTISLDMVDKSQAVNLQIWQGKSLTERGSIVQTFYDIPKGRSTHTFTWPGDATRYMIINLSLPVASDVGSYTFKRNIMLEKGPIAHDYAPAPQDQAADNVYSVDFGDSDDINNFTDPGQYLIRNIGASDLTARHNPCRGNGWGSLFVYKNNQYINQTMIDDNMDPVDVYYRSKNWKDNHDWTAWIKNGAGAGADTAQVQAIQSSLAASSSAASQAQAMASQAQATASAALPVSHFTWDSLSGKPSLAKQTDVDSLASAVGTNAEIANGEIAALNQKIGLVGKAVAEGGQAGQDGQNGITPHIDGTTGNWYLGTTDTGVHAQGPQGDPGDSGAPGLTPHIDPSNGHWMLGTTDTGVTARGEAASAPSIDDSAYKEPGSGLVAKIINEADDRGTNVRHFGLVGDGSTDNTNALRALATWADQQPGKQIIFFPPGTYVWSGSVQFNQQVELTGTEDTWLQYTGTGSALILGKDGITDADHLDYRSFTVHNLGFVGGDNADYLIHFNNFVTQSRVSYCRFHNAGGLNHTQGQYCVYFNRDAWDGRVEHCQFDAAPGQGQRQFVSMEEYGNSRIMVTNNLVTSLTGFGTAVYLNGANCMITHNKIEGFQCNVRLGKAADHSIVAFNYFEKNGRSMASACVEVGNFNATDSAAPKYLYIANNYANLHNVAGLMYSTLIGPSGPKSLIRDTLLSNNTINGGNWSADTPAFGYLVRENNLAGQTGNHISGYYLSIGIQALMDTSTTDGSANRREAWTMDDDRATSGQNGKTPVRGVDYWTDSDIATIKGYVDDAILNGKW